jgi:hypothetical protein
VSAGIYVGHGRVAISAYHLPVVERGEPSLRGICGRGFATRERVDFETWMGLRQAGLVCPRCLRIDDARRAGVVSKRRMDG